MGRHRWKALIGALLMACASSFSSAASGAGRSALRLDLYSGEEGSGHVPGGFRVVITNRSSHEVAGGNLCLTFYAGDEFYAWGRQEYPVEFTLGPGEKVVQVLRMSSLVLNGPEGQQRAPAAIASRLTHSRWSVVASVVDDSVEGPASVTVRSNELEFSPGSVRPAKQ